MPGKKKNKDKGAQAEASAEPTDESVAAAKGGGKGRTMLLSAGLVLLGISMQRFVLAGAPEQTIVMAAPAAVAEKKGSHSVDCVKYEAEREAAAEEGSGGSDGAEKTATKPHAKPPAEASTGLETVNLDEMTINLADTDRDRYLRIGIALKLAEGITVDAFKPEQAKASDVAVRYFSAKTLADLQGVEMMDRSKAELTCLIQAAYEEEITTETTAKKGAEEVAHEPKVTEVLFTSYLTQ